MPVAQYLECHFVDHKTSSKSHLRKLFAQADAPGRLDQEPNLVWLRTCLRSEVYSEIPLIQSAHSLLGDASKTIRGYDSVFSRLVALLSGLESQIIGERFILQQVSRAFQQEQVAGALVELFRRASSIAQNIRKKYDFYSTHDYDDIAFHMIKSVTRTKRPPALVVVGSGMLAKAIVTHEAAKQYSTRIVVSRAHKSMRKQLTGIDSFVKPITFLKRKAFSPFDLIIATTGFSTEYEIAIRSILNLKERMIAVDFSSFCGTVDDNLKDLIFPMYGNAFNEAIKHANDPLMAKMEMVVCAIEEAVVLEPTAI